MPQCSPGLSGRWYDKTMFGRLGMKDTQSPVDQDIQRPVLHAFTMDRKTYHVLGPVIN